MTRFIAAFAGLIVSTISLFADGDPKAVSFEKNVLGVFQKHCYSCHDGSKQKSGFRLDVRSHAQKGGESGKPGFKAGKSAESEIYRRLITTDEGERMPPKGGPLSAAEIAAIKNWIDSGAAWPDALANEKKAPHWAFVPPVKADVPKGSSAVDYFIRKRLTQAGLSPSKQADRVTLIRRLSLDLIGLPPTPKEVDEFLADKSPEAYTKLVDRLLASPHYGERWGRIWLDSARYADSDGFEKDKPRFVWFYRDWVINSLNKNMPYDQFLTEQLAGDLLPNATQDQLVATGFLRNSMINEEGGVDPEQFRMEAMFDRMDAVGKAMLGLTIQCAQCHSHKYDPITQTEYYRLFAYLNRSNESNVTVYTAEERAQRADLFRKIAAIENELKHRSPNWPEQMAKWEKSVKGNQPNWIIVKPSVQEESTGGSKYLLQPDGSILVLGYAPTKHGVKLDWATHLDRITGFRIELLNDPNMPRNGPGRSIEGTGALSEFDVSVAPADGSKKPVKVKFVRATSDSEMKEAANKPIYDDKSKKKRVLGPASYAIDGKDDTAWGHDIDPGRRNLPRMAVFVPETPIPGFAGGIILHFVLRQNHGGWNSDDNQNQNLGRFRISVTTAKDPVADPLPVTVRRIVETVPADKRSEAQTRDVFKYWRTTVADWKQANDQIDELWKQHPEGTTQLVYKEMAQPRGTAILKRGDFLKPGELVSAGIPVSLNPMPKDAPVNRLGLARWLTDKSAPTTARSYVNRVWQAYFGVGIVSTSEDLGTMCDPPTHPELLDWLAADFVESGWDIKKLHQQIVMSETYRQSSQVTTDQLAKDPANRLLARSPRVRVDAEIVRDIALTASGLLNPQVGGPSVYPPIPAFLMQPPASYGPKTWPESKGADRYRRALYTFRYRSVPHPALAAFDAPNGDYACVKRTRSNTPLQALAGLNEPLFVEAAQALAARILKESGDDRAKLTAGFRFCTARTPNDREQAVLADLLKTERDRWTKADAKPAELIGEPTRYDAKTAPAEAAAWVAVARVLLNLDETVTKE
ncbi:MAG: PSD1 and planctomycete cytochrome C domain-containing protein [Gemmataceae bacterium]